MRQRLLEATNNGFGILNLNTEEQAGYLVDLLGMKDIDAYRIGHYVAIKRDLPARRYKREYLTALDYDPDRII